MNIDKLINEAKTIEKTIDLIIRAADQSLFNISQKDLENVLKARLLLRKAVLKMQMIDDTVDLLAEGIYVEKLLGKAKTCIKPFADSLSEGIGSIQKALSDMLMSHQDQLNIKLVFEEAEFEEEKMGLRELLDEYSKVRG